MCVSQTLSESLIFYSDYILDDDEQPGAPDVVTDAPTSLPYNDIDNIKKSFSFSMNFNDKDNPWL